MREKFQMLVQFPKSCKSMSGLGWRLNLRTPTLPPTEWQESMSLRYYLQFPRVHMNKKLGLKWKLHSQTEPAHGIKTSQVEIQSTVPQWPPQGFKFVCKQITLIIIPPFMNFQKHHHTNYFTMLINYFQLLLYELFYC